MVERRELGQGGGALQRRGRLAAGLLCLTCERLGRTRAARARARGLSPERPALRGGGDARRPRLQRHREGDRGQPARSRPGRGRGEHLPDARAARQAAADPPRGRRRGRRPLRADRTRAASTTITSSARRCGEVSAFEDSDLERAIERLAGRVDYAIDGARRDAAGRVPRLPRPLEPAGRSSRARRTCRARARPHPRRARPRRSLPGCPSAPASPRTAGRRCSRPPRVRSPSRCPGSRSSPGRRPPRPRGGSARTSRCDVARRRLRLRRQRRDHRADHLHAVAPREVAERVVRGDDLALRRRHALDAGGDPPVERCAASGRSARRCARTRARPAGSSFVELARGSPPRRARRCVGSCHQCGSSSRRFTESISVTTSASPPALSITSPSQSSTSPPERNTRSLAPPPPRRSAAARSRAGRRPGAACRRPRPERRPPGARGRRPAWWWPRRSRRPRIRSRCRSRRRQGRQRTTARSEHARTAPIVVRMILSSVESAGVRLPRLVDPLELIAFCAWCFAVALAGGVVGPRAREHPPSGGAPRGLPSRRGRRGQHRHLRRGRDSPPRSSTCAPGASTGGCSRGWRRRRWWARWPAATCPARCPTTVLLGRHRRGARLLRHRPAARAATSAALRRSAAAAEDLDIRAAVLTGAAVGVLGGLVGLILGSLRMPALIRYVGESAGARGRARTSRSASAWASPA